MTSQRAAGTCHHVHVHLSHCLTMAASGRTSSLLSGTPMAPLLITELKGVSPAAAPMSATHSCNSAAASIFMPYLQSHCTSSSMHQQPTDASNGRQARCPGHPPDVYEPSRFDGLRTGHDCTLSGRVLTAACCVPHKVSAGRHKAFQRVRGRPRCLEHWAAHSGSYKAEEEVTVTLMSFSCQISHREAMWVQVSNEPEIQSEPQNSQCMSASTACCCAAARAACRRA